MLREKQFLSTGPTTTGGGMELPVESRAGSPGLMWRYVLLPGADTTFDLHDS